MMASLNFGPMRIGWMNIVFWTKRGQTQPACQPSKVVQKEPKGTKMVFLTLWDPFGSIWTLLDHFKQKLIFCSEAPPPNPILSIWGKQFIFALNGLIGSR